MDIAAPRTKLSAKESNVFKTVGEVVKVLSQKSDQDGGR